MIALFQMHFRWSHKIENFGLCSRVVKRQLSFVFSLLPFFAMKYEIKLIIKPLYA